MSKDKLEIKDINTYLVSSIDVKNGSKIVREIVSLQYKVVDAPSFERLEKDWRNYKQNQSLVILSITLLSTHQEVYFNGKPVTNVKPNAEESTPEEPKEEAPKDENPGN